MIPKSLKFYLDEMKHLNEDDLVWREAVPFNIIMFLLLKKEVLKASVLESYLKTLGFPSCKTSDALTLRIKETYLPLIKIECCDETLSSENDILTKAFYDLLSSSNENIRECVELALVEVFNNLRDHSKASSVVYTAQKWNDDILEFALYDNGRGFQESLKAESELIALQKAILEKASGTNDPERGRGLQVLKTLVLNKEVLGEFLLISNDSYCYMSTSDLEPNIIGGQLPFSIWGSLLVLRLNNLLKTDFSKIYEIMLEPDDFVLKNNLIR
ncbi:hypothetical protein H6501_05160 [Candidatus Woesearchaeota archaeon]|nr:hypothetical protein [Nanoarchaeota archaeon]MCB9370962.1 hypothetical protein [Candidatus Woesearchaeota archaeon]USN44064.1 MAG: hypothetical protein H6500_06775 [Candidatus Woesearchaeota archaeon]